MSSDGMSASPRDDDGLDLAGLIASQDEDALAMPPPRFSLDRAKSSVGPLVDFSPLSAHADVGHSSPLHSSARINVDIPKPHFPSKAQRRSSLPSSETADSPSSTNASSGRSLQHAGLLVMNGMDPTHPFNAPLSLEHQPFGAATIYGRPPPFGRPVGVPVLQQPVPSAAHLRAAQPDLVNRSKTMYVTPSQQHNNGITSPVGQRANGMVQRSFSTPGVTGHASNGTSSPLDESPSRPPNGTQHGRHPSNSTSSLGPNVAGRIGVGGNVMVDPHGPANGQKSGNAGAGAFVYKVYNMLLDPSFQHLISFNANGQSFTVSNVTDFSKTVLPKHFKHNNFSSFVRQLNMYGFHKVNKTPRGQRGENNTGVWEFVHPKFLRGRPDLLDQIRRKPLEAETPRKDSAPPLLSTFQMQQRMMGIPPDARLPSQPSSAPPQQHRPSGMASGPPSMAPPPQFFMQPANPSPSEGARVPPAAVTMAAPPVAGAAGAPPPNPHPPPPPSHPHPVVPGAAMPSGVPGGPSAPHFFGPLPPLQVLPPHPHPGPVDPIEALTSVQGEVLGRLHGVQDGYEALYRELYETRRRQDVLVELASQMYHALQTLAPNKVQFSFPNTELFYRSPEDNTPIFRITDHDPSHQVVHIDPRTQQPIPLAASPSNSDFGFPNAQSPERRVSLDPATFGAFGSLALHSNPASPALLGPRESLPSPYSSDFGDVNTSTNSSTSRGLGTTNTGAPTPNFMGMNGSNGSGGGASGLHLTTDGLLAPGPSSAMTPLSPGSAFSTAVATPLPPSPSPFQHGKLGHSMVGLGMDLSINGATAAVSAATSASGSGTSVNGSSNSVGASADATLFLSQHSPVGNGYYDAEASGVERSGVGGGAWNGDDGNSPLSSFPNGVGILHTGGGGGAGAGCGSSKSPTSGGASHQELDFLKGEELDIAGLMSGPGTLSYQGCGNGKGKKRPATGSMDLNMQPSR